MPLPETGVREKGRKRATVTTSLLQKIRSALSIQRTQVKETVGRNKLSHFDEDIIDIVGMLFEVMLNDKRLGNTVKALLSHLHTPYLKIAIRDRTFLEHREYPARRLFDEMIEAGSRWVDEQDLTQGLYPQLQTTVERIVRAKDHPIQLFQELEDKLTSEIKQLSEKQKVKEARTVETEKGKARLEEAKLTAAIVTKPLLAIEGAPERYKSFITGPWTDYLTLIYLRSGGDTDTGNWRSAQVLNNRIHSLVSILVAGQRPLHAEVVTLRDEFNRRLEKLIPQYQSEVTQLFEIFAEDYKPGEATAKPAAETPSESETAADTVPEIELSPNGEALLTRLPNLPRGTWIVFHDLDDGDKVVKMSWFNAKTERFLFVDQSGAKAMAISLRDFCDAIDRERAHVLHASGTSYVESSLKRAMAALEHRA